jgi:hypothetical protein
MNQGKALLDSGVKELRLEVGAPRVALEYCNAISYIFINGFFHLILGC